jgi:hypothetical protein
VDVPLSLQQASFPIAYSEGELRASREDLVSVFDDTTAMTDAVAAPTKIAIDVSSHVGEILTGWWLGGLKRGNINLARRSETLRGW